MKLSIIIPCKNEEGNVNNLYEAISKVLGKKKYELIFIDDGSTDKTLVELKKLYEKDMQHMKVLSFSRNFMKEAAILAGLEASSGEYTCIIDGDLQQNPKYLIDMMEFLDDNSDYDEVAMVMNKRTTESKFMSFCKNMFYKTMNNLCEINLENAASDFRMFRSNVKNALISLSEKNRFSKGLFSWVGFNIKYMPYEVEPRESGKSSFGFKASLRYAISGIIAFSEKPLKLGISLGCLSILASFIYLIILLIQILDFGFEATAIHALIIITLFLFGLNFILLGIIGKYLGTINIEVRKRPTYIIKEKLGFDNETIL